MMTAAQIVALAKRAAPEAQTMRAFWENMKPERDATLLVFDDGAEIVADGLPPTRKDAMPVMRAALTPENTASEETLARALVASAFQYIAMDEGTVAVTWPGMPRNVRPGEHDSETEAREALLDALFSSTETLTPADCRCNGTGHDDRGEPCDGPKGDGCYTTASKLADANALAEVL
jgi:hypothetical protein